jgi:FPC/CPF motif-containing protein YcgG
MDNYKSTGKALKQRAKVSYYNNQQKTKIYQAPSINTVDTLNSFIIEDKHPCVMAASAHKNENITAKDYGELGTIKTAYRIMTDLKNFGDMPLDKKTDFKSHLAIFSNTVIDSEKDFENLLWSQLKIINSLDEEDWDSSVSSDPDSENFSFSISGTAFYMVGMHPKSSRKARQFPYPAIAFNMHKQFEKLRDFGIYEKIKSTIRKRDTKLQGSINPMVEDFGSRSEARQYSGRKVSNDWKCPFSNTHQ